MLSGEPGIDPLRYVDEVDPELQGLFGFDKIDEDVNILSDTTKSNSRMYEPIRNLAPSLFPFIDFWDDEDKTDEDEAWYKKLV